MSSVGALLLILAVSSLYFFVADDGNEVSVGDDEDVLSVTDDGNELGITVDEESDSGLTNAEEIDASDREAATELIETVETVETVAEPTPVPRNIDELVERGALMLDPETTEPYSGQAFELFLAADSTNPFGPHTTTYTYTDGERHGPAWSHYNDNGQLLDTATYTAGELDGPGEWYYENGQLEVKGAFNMGQKCGEWIEDGETVTFDPCPPGLEGGN